METHGIPMAASGFSTKTIIFPKVFHGFPIVFHGFSIYMKTCPVIRVLGTLFAWALGFLEKFCLA